MRFSEVGQIKHYGNPMVDAKRESDLCSMWKCRWILCINILFVLAFGLWVYLTNSSTTHGSFVHLQ
jgi:hypothetical protein